jgi:hypothetical protein
MLKQFVDTLFLVYLKCGIFFASSPWEEFFYEAPACGFKKSGCLKRFGGRKTLKHFRK